MVSRLQELKAKLRLFCTKALEAINMTLSGSSDRVDSNTAFPCCGALSSEGSRIFFLIILVNPPVKVIPDLQDVDLFRRCLRQLRTAHDL